MQSSRILMNKGEDGIVVGLFFCMLARIFLQSNILFFVISFAYFIYLALSGYVLKMPRIGGLIPFAIMMILWFFGGICANGLRASLRDAYYFMPSILWICIGYILSINLEKLKGRSVVKTIYVFGLINALHCFASFVISGDSSFNGIRQTFVSNVYDIGFVVALIVHQLFLKERYYFSKKTDIGILLILVIQVALSLGRISIAEPVLAVFIMLITVMLTEGFNRSFSGDFKVLLGFFCFICIALIIMPHSATTVLLSKISRTFLEIDASETISSVDQAIINWRAYEIQSALDQWMGSGISVKLFGAFLGKGVHIAYVPYSWSEMVQNNEIPLLHNGYLTVLPKMGLLGLLLFLSVYVALIHKAIKAIRFGFSTKSQGILLLAITVSAVFVTYVVRGPIAEQAFLVWSILVGYLTGKMERCERASIMP